MGSCIVGSVVDPDSLNLDLDLDTDPDLEF